METEKLKDHIYEIPWGMVIGESDTNDDVVEMLTDIIIRCC